MSFTDRLLLWLHVGLAIFTIGPVTAAIMSTPRYIRKRDLVVVRYLYRTTRIFTIISLGVLIAGLILAKQLRDFSKPWLTVSLTLFVVAFALLVLILRDQHRAIAALGAAGTAQAAGPAAGQAVSQARAQATAGAGARSEDSAAEDSAAEDSGSVPPALAGTQPAPGAHGHVERGRIATIGGVVGALWLVILILMVWNS